MNRDDIIKILYEKKQFLQENFGIEKIGIFGSYARGEANEESDIDIYIEFDMRKVDIDKYFSLLETLEKLFGKKVDIVTRDGKNTIRVLSVKENIEKEILYV